MSDQPIRPGEPVRLEPRVRRLTQDNPGPFTGPGTNSFLVGVEALFVLDPGEDDDRHFEALLAAIDTTPVVAVIPTHAHPDHWPLAPRLARRLGAPTLGFTARDGYRPDRLLRDGECLEAPGVRLRAIHTPGHARDHLCFLLEGGEPEIGPRRGGSLFSGDHVMGWSTSIIAPPDGNLNAYLRSLERLLELAPSRLYSAHGPTIEEPRRRIEEILAHRRERSRQLLSALDRGPASIAELTPRIYHDLEPRLLPAASQSLLAHVLALLEEGEIAVDEIDPDPLAVRYRRS